jgi:hypothetical protein
LVSVTNSRPGDGTQRPLRLVLAGVLAVAIGLAVYVAAFAHTSTAGPTGPVSGDLAAVRSGRRAVRVLFVGNSFTAANGLTGMITRLAADAPGSTCPVLAVQYTPGGSTLADALKDRRVTHLISSEHWDAVVLQDQSQLPSLPDWRASEMLPSVGQLGALTRFDGALPMLFETWGYRDGDAMNFPEGDTYAAMQRRLRDGYAIAGRLNHLPIAPVGDAWQLALAHDPSLSLWSSDDEHPSTLGSYLAAVTLWQELATRLHPLDCHLSTRQSSFTGGLASSQADALQRYGESAVAQAGTPSPASG